MPRELCHTVDVFGVVAGTDCAVCGQPLRLVAPPCAEGHGEDCPDRICADCGAAIFLDPVVVPSVHDAPRAPRARRLARRRRSSRVA